MLFRSNLMIFVTQQLFISKILSFLRVTHCLIPQGFKSPRTIVKESKAPHIRLKTSPYLENVELSQDLVFPHLTQDAFWPFGSPQSTLKRATCDRETYPPTRLLEVALISLRQAQILARGFNCWFCSVRIISIIVLLFPKSSNILF